MCWITRFIREVVKPGTIRKWKWKWKWKYSLVTRTRSAVVLEVAVPFEFSYRSVHELRTAITEKGALQNTDDSLVPSRLHGGRLAFQASYLQWLVSRAMPTAHETAGL